MKLEHFVQQFHIVKIVQCCVKLCNMFMLCRDSSRDPPQLSHSAKYFQERRRQRSRTWALLSHTGVLKWPLSGFSYLWSETWTLCSFGRTYRTGLDNIDRFHYQPWVISFRGAYSQGYTVTHATYSWFLLQQLQSQRCACVAQRYIFLHKIHRKSTISMFGWAEYMCTIPLQLLIRVGMYCRYQSMWSKLIF